MLDIGFQEILVLMVIALIVFGPDKLPDLGRRLGRAMREFRRASDEFRTTIETNLAITEEVPLPPSASSYTPPPAPEVTSPDAPVTAAPGEGAPAPSPDPAAEPVPAVAGLPGGDPFGARRGGHLLHRATCHWLGRIPEAERLPLKTASEGVGMGLLACPMCEPRDEEPAA
jgi:TatA/E family protein of Tat protein translocase